jgi:hypothetical protein
MGIGHWALGIRHLRKLMHDPSPNLSPKRREALIPPSLVGKGGRGLGLRVNLRFLNLFRRCLLGKIPLPLSPCSPRTLDIKTADRW